MGKRMRAVVAACVLGMCMMLVLAGCSGGETYAPKLKDAAVTSPTIGESGTLRVGVNAEKAPLAGMSNDEIIGMDVDIAAALADQLGLKLSIVDVGTDPEGALKDSKVDIVMGLDAKAGSADTYWTSEEYLPTGIALFALTSSNASAPAADSNPAIAAQISSTSAWAVSNSFGDSALKTATNLSDAFKQLSAGSVQYVAADAIIGAYSARAQDVDVQIVGMLSDATSYYIGVAGTNANLQKVVGETLETIKTGGVIDVIEKKWLGEKLDFSGVTKIEAKPAPDPAETDPAASSSAAAAA